MSYKKHIGGKKLHSGSVANKAGVKFTAKEQKIIQTLTQQANKQIKNRINNMGEIRKKEHYETNKDKGKWNLEKKTVNLNKIPVTNEKEKERYIKSLRNLATGKTYEKQEKNYYENAKHTIRSIFGSRSKEAKTLIKGLEKIKPSNFWSMTEEKDLPAIKEMYNKNGDEVRAMYESLKEAFGVYDNE